jgi:DNA-binding IclR family transcriptional regulator
MTASRADNRPIAGPRVRPVPAVTRSIAILRLLGSGGGSMTLKAISQELGMVTSTCLHILRVLVEERLVKIDASTKRYSLDVGMLLLARSVIESNPFTSLVQPVLDRLSKKWNVTTIGVEASGIDHLVVLAVALSDAPFRLQVDVGSRFPALTSATGRLVAAYSRLPAAEIERRFKVAKWEQPPDLETWSNEVQTVRGKGFSIDRGNFMSGILVIAVPVLDSLGRMTHALVAAGVADQFGAVKSRSLAKELQAEAATLAQLMAVRR